MNKKASSTHSTILVIVLGLLVLSFLFRAPVLVPIATIIGVAAMAVPLLGRWIEWLWFKLAEGLGWFNSRLLLGLVFFVVLFPIAVLYRLTRKNPLFLQEQPKSVFTTRDHKYTKKDLENMW